MGTLEVLHCPALLRKEFWIFGKEFQRVRVLYCKVWCLSLCLNYTCQINSITKVKNNLDNNGFSGIWFKVDSKKTIIPVIHQIFHDVHLQNCHSEMSNNRCVNYNIIKVNENFERYLAKLKYWDLANLRCFRCGDTKTAVESNTYMFSLVLCSLCNSGDYADEFHLFMKCPYFSSHRALHVTPYYYVRPSV